MKSLYFDKYGSSEVLSIRDIPKPSIKPGHVLVKIHSVSLNPLDWRLMQADPFLVRTAFGIFKPKLNGLGADFSGVVESVDDGVSELKTGDAVFGIMTPNIVGALSEYIVIPASALATKPDTLPHAHAATLGIAALTAYEGIHDYRLPKEGEQVLINGASGGIGTFAVQMAKALGAQVTGVCSERNARLVLEFGADKVIDYQAVDLLKTRERFDLIYDAIGNHAPKEIKPLLKPGGRLILASAKDSMGFLNAMRTAKKDASIDLIVDLKKGKSRLEALRDLVETRKVTPVIDREYPFKDVARAIDYVATKRARGKVVVNLLDQG